MPSFIDHTLLKPEAGENDYIQLVEEALKWNFYSVCVPPNKISFVNKRLRGKGVVKICTVVGFPWGYSCSKTKIDEAQTVADLGVDEIDMVMGVGQLKDKNYKSIVDETARIKEIGPSLKVIIETGLLSSEEIKQASLLCVEGGADFVKTSTGFVGGVDTNVIRIIKETVGDKIKIKASGGIASYREALGYIEGGVDRLGTSRGCSIMKEFQESISKII